MIVARTDHGTGRRHYEVPQALADIAMALFPDDDQTGAVFHLARRLSLRKLGRVITATSN